MTRAATSRRPSTAFSSAASMRRTAIRSPGRNSTTSSPGSTGSSRMRRLLKAEGVPVVLIGDYNVVPTERDIYPTKSYDKDALVQPQSRAAFARLLKQGWTDAIRALHPDERIYTFWDYMRNRWPRDAGLRLDHILLSPDLAARLKTSGVDRAVRGKPNASDHAPVWIELGAPKKARKSASLSSARPKAQRKVKSANATAARAPAAGHRRRFLRASRLSRASEKHPAGWRKTCRRDPRLRQYAAAPLSGGASARGPRRMGHAGRFDVSAPEVSRVSERARIRRCHRRTAGCAAGVRAGLRLQDRETCGIRG